MAFAPGGIIGAFLPIHLKETLNASYFLISLVSLVPALETIVISPFWGGRLDKTGKGYRIIIVSFLVQALGFSILPFLSNALQFVLIVALAAIFTSSFVPVYSAIATWSSHQYGRAIGGFWTSASLGSASAALLGGIVYQLSNATYLWVLGAAYGYIGCLAVLLLPKRGLSPTRVAVDSRGYLNLLRRPEIARLCTVSLLAIIATAAFNSFFTVYFVHSLGGSKIMAGLAVAGTTLLGALTFKIVGPLNDKVGRKPVFLFGAIGYVAYFLTIYFVTNPVIAAILWVLPIYPLIQSSAAAMMSDYTSSGDRGKGLGLLASAISLGGGLGPLAGGLIADAFGLNTVIVFSLGVASATVVLSQLFLRENVARTVETIVSAPAI